MNTNMNPMNGMNMNGMNMHGMNAHHPHRPNHQSYPNHRNMMAMRAAAASATGMPPPNFVPSGPPPPISVSHGPPHAHVRGGMMSHHHHPNHGMYPGGPTTATSGPHPHGRFGRQHPMNNMNNMNNINNSNKDQQHLQRFGNNPNTMMMNPAHRINNHQKMMDTSSSFHHNHHHHHQQQHMNNAGPGGAGIVNMNMGGTNSSRPSPIPPTSQTQLIKEKGIEENTVSNTTSSTVSLVESQSSIGGGGLDELSNSTTAIASSSNGNPTHIQTTTATSTQQQDGANYISPCSSITTTQTQDHVKPIDPLIQNSTTSKQPQRFHFQQQQQESSNNITSRSTEKELDAASILCSLSRIIPSAEDVSFSSSLIEQSIQGSIMKKNSQGDISSRKAVASSSCDNKSGNDTTVTVTNAITDETKTVMTTTDSRSSRSNESASSRPYPTRLAIVTDSRELNSLHCFVRDELLELFTVKESNYTTNSNATNNNQDKIVPTVSNDDDSCTSPSSSSGRTSSSSPQQSPSSSVAQQPTCSSRVGLRCVHCASEFRNGTNASMSMFYPRKLTDLYKMVCTWQRVHYAKCKHIPTSVRRTYSELKKNDKTRGKTAYWVTSARFIGLVDDEKYGGGVRFLNK